MDFEDIVDMDWLNSNTTTDETLLSSSPSLTAIKHEPIDSFSSGLPDYCHDGLYGFSDQPMLWQNDFAADLDMNLEPALSPASSSLPDKQETQEKDAAAPPMPELVMPSTEHIKQLIEIARRHLALREQQQQQEQGKAAQDKEAQQQQQPTKDQEISQQSGDLQRLYNETAPIPFFVHPVSSVPDTVAPESLIKSNAAATAAPEEQPKKAGSPPPAPSTRRASSVSLAAGAEEAMTLEAYAESDGIDIKKLTPKERRQLRNKISARNFRVRRKEYITTLEAQVDDHKKHAERLKSRLDDVEEENKQLRLEVDSLRRQNQLLQQQQQQGKSVAGPSSPGSPRVSSPIPKPNLNKDISMLGSKASETYRHDTRILVSNAVMPVWDFDRIFTAQQPTRSAPPPQILAPPEPIMQFAGYMLSAFVQLYRAADFTLPESSSVVELDDHTPLLPDDRDFTQSDAWEKSNAVPPTSASPAYMEYLYDTLIMSALTTNARTHKSFWWWDTPAFHQ